MASAPTHDDTPRGREPEAEPEDRYTIEDQDGNVRRYTWDTLLVALAGDYSGTKPMALGEPLGPSELSGEPGYRVRFADLTLMLTRDEFQRLFLAALTPAEYRTLHARYGGFALIDATHYDPASGTAQAPKVRVPS
jgi:hypothetical protein